MAVKNDNSAEQIDLSKVVNFPKDAVIQRSKGHVYVIRREYVIDHKCGRRREIRKTLGQIIDNKFYSQDEYKRHFRRGMVPRETPRFLDLANDIINSPEIVENLPVTQLEYLSNVISGTVGPVPLFWQLSINCGLYDDLIHTFVNKDICAEVICIAIFFIVEANTSARHFDNFLNTHYTPCKATLNSQRLSDFYKNLSVKDEFFKKLFFIRRASHVAKDNSLIIIDSTNILTSASRYSLAEIGLTKENKYASQVNFAISFDYNTHSPICYEVIPGKNPDSTSLGALLTQLRYIGLGHRCIAILDRGYCTVKNIIEAQELGFKCCFALKLNSRWVRRAVNKALSEFNSSKCLIYSGRVEAYSVKVRLNDSNNNNKGTVWVHVFRSLTARSDERHSLYKRLEDFENKWKAKQGKNVKSLIKDNLMKYFYYDKDDFAKPLIYNYDKIDLALKYAGCFANVTTYQCSALESFETYDVRSDIERVFRSGKRDIKFDILRTHSDSYSSGKMMVMFVALILLEAAKQELSKERYKFDKKGNKTIDLTANKFDINDVLHLTKSMRFLRKPISGDCFFISPTATQHDIAKAMGCDGLFMRNLPYKNE